MATLVVIFLVASAVLLIDQLGGDDNPAPTLTLTTGTVVNTPTQEENTSPPTEMPTQTPTLSHTPQVFPSFTDTPLPDDLLVTLANSYPAPGRSAEGITWDGEYLWVSTNDSRIFKLNTTGKTLASYSSPEPTPGGMAWDGTYLWIYTTNMDQIYQFEIDGNAVHVVSSLPAPTEVFGGGITHDLAWDNRHYLWYANQNNLYQLTSSGDIEKTVAHPKNVTGLAWDGSYLWVIYNRSFENAVLEVLDTTGDVLGSFDLPVFEVYGLTFGGNGKLWVTGQRSFTETDNYIFELDASAVQATFDQRSAPAWQVDLFTLYEAEQLSQSGIGLTPQPPFQPQAGRQFLVGDVGLITEEYSAVLYPADITLVDAAGQAYSPVGLEMMVGSYIVGDLSGEFTLRTSEPASITFDFTVEAIAQFSTQTTRSEMSFFAGESEWPIIRLVWEVPDDIELVSLTVPGMSITDLPEIMPIF